MEKNCTKKNIYKTIKKIFLLKTLNKNVKMSKILYKTI